MTETKKVSSDDRIWGSLSYFWILSIIILAMKKDNDFVRFHANQGALLFIISLVAFVPLLGQLALIIVMIMALIGIAKAYSGAKWKMPVIGNAAKEFGGWIVKTLKI